jgi:hypothetical protein
MYARARSVAHIVPTICPQLHVFLVICRDVFLQVTLISPRHQVVDENHDFFSGSGSSYVIGKAVNTEDEDWDF